MDTQTLEFLNKHPNGGQTAGTTIAAVTGSGAVSGSSNTSTAGNSTSNNAINPDGKNEPSPGYTLRATIDCERNEIYIFSVSFCIELKP